MPDSSPLPASETQTVPVQMEQVTQGDRNQSIGQVLGGMVVYVSGGQAVINTGSEGSAEGAQKVEKPEQPKLGENPYKGLLAFKETDGDRFFGRDTQIEQLWEQFRGLHDEYPQTIRYPWRRLGSFERS